MSLLDTIQSYRERDAAFGFAYNIWMWPFAVCTLIIFYFAASSVRSEVFVGSQDILSLLVYAVGWIVGWFFLSLILFGWAYFTKKAGDRYPNLYLVLLPLPILLGTIAYGRWFLTLSWQGLAVLFTILALGFGTLFFTVLNWGTWRYSFQAFESQKKSQISAKEIILLVLIYTVTVGGFIYGQEQYIAWSNTVSEMQTQGRLAETERTERQLKRKQYTIQKVNTHWDINEEDVSLEGSMSARGTLHGEYNQIIHINLGREVTLQEERRVVLNEREESVKFRVDDIHPKITEWMQTSLVSGFDGRASAQLLADVFITLQPISIAGEQSFESEQFAHYRRTFTSQETVVAPQITVKRENGTVKELSLE